MAAINFPDNPPNGATFSHTYNGLTQNWIYKSDIPGWISQGFGITQGEQGLPGTDGATGATGTVGEITGGGVGMFNAPKLAFVEGTNITISGLTSDAGITLTIEAGGGVVGSTGSTGATGATGIVGIITGGGVGMFNAPSLSFYSPDNSVKITGITSASGITISLTAGGGVGGANPEGPEGSIQFADSSSLSGIAEARIVAVNDINNQRGFSGNFVYYTESATGNSNSITTDGTPITVPFGTRNIYVVDNIALQGGQTLTIQGFDASYTGASMTLILGHTGEATSSIKFPGSQGIYWSNGPFGVTTGTDSYIYTRPSPKKFDILYFFADGTRVYGNLMRDFRTSR
jgi:hypothetical protein